MSSPIDRRIMTHTGLTASSNTRSRPITCYQVPRVNSELIVGVRSNMVIDGQISVTKRRETWRAFKYGHLLVNRRTLAVHALPRITIYMYEYILSECVSKTPQRCLLFLGPTGFLLIPST